MSAQSRQVMRQHENNFSTTDWLLDRHLNKRLYGSRHFLHILLACAADADETRLRELCSDLLGPVRPSGDGAAESSEKWQPQVNCPSEPRLAACMSYVLLLQ